LVNTKSKLLHWHRFEAYLYHVITKLSWDLLEHQFFKVAKLFCFAVCYKLDDVSFTDVAWIALKQGSISVKFLHAIEVSIANSDDDH
jgi:hypothetical protein